MKVGTRMRMGRAVKRGVPLLALAGAISVLSGFTNAAAQPATSVQAGQAVTQAGPGCQNYTPTQLAVDRTMYIAGDAITVTGIVMPNDSVTATLSGGTIGTLNLGGTTANASGQFSITGALPNPLTAGSYTVTVTSTGCPTAGTISIAVVDVKSSSCTASRETRTFYPGQRVNFSLFTPIYSTAHPVRMDLLRPSYGSTLYNGVWPTNDVVQFTIPATATPGTDYTLQQTATRKNGNGTNTKSCPVWIEPIPASVLALTQGQSQSSQWVGDQVAFHGDSVKSDKGGPLNFAGGDAAPLASVVGVLLVAGFALVQLRRRVVSS